MTETIHTDEVERLRVALWDCAPRDAADGEHVATCPACVVEIAETRRLRDTWRRYASAGLPRTSAEALIAAAASFPAVVWSSALPVTAAGAARGPAASDVHLAWAGEDLRVEVMLRPEAGRGYAVTGQVLRDEVVPAARVEVELLIDRRTAAATVTDAFGEFAFDPRSGAEIGIRIGAGREARHVALWPTGGAR